MPAPSIDLIRQNLQKRFKEAMQETLVEHPSASSAFDTSLDIPLPSFEASSFRLPPAHDFAENVKRREEEVSLLKETLAETQEREDRLEAERDAARAALGTAEEQVRGLSAAADGLREKLSRAEADMRALRNTLPRKDEQIAAQMETVKTLERRLVEKDRELSESRDRFDDLTRETERLNSLIRSSPADVEKQYKNLEQGLAERSEALREKTRRVQELEQLLAEREKSFQEQREQTQKAQEELRADLSNKETEFRLLNEDINRMGQQNKELLSKIQEYQRNEMEGPQGERPASEVMPEGEGNLQEKLESLELSLQERDRMLEDQQKSMQELSQRMASLADENHVLRQSLSQKERDEQATLKNLGALAEQNKSLEARVAGMPTATEYAAQKNALEAREKQMRAEMGQKSQRADALEKEKTDLESKLKLQSADFKKSQEECADLRFKLEELETQVRLLVMNSESIDRMEKNLRDTFRLMTPTYVPALPHGAPAVQGTVESPGFFARLAAWWSAPLVKIPFFSRKKAPPASGPEAVTPAVKRFREFQARRRSGG